jgi:hypothetical protein
VRRGVDHAEGNDPSSSLSTKVGSAEAVTAIQQMSTDQLVERFAEIAIAQDRALLYDERKTFNRLFQEMNDVDNELKSRGNDARRGLMRLYVHPNLQVRVKSAIRTLAVAPAEARKVLEALRDGGDLPQALDAGMTLSNLDRGIFRPD